MSDWRQIQARIRKAKSAADPVAQLAALYERTRDAMVAFELARHHEKIGANQDAARWYTSAAERFRRAQWKVKAQEALTRLGAPIPATLNPESVTTSASDPASAKNAEQDAMFAGDPDEVSDQTPVSKSDSPRERASEESGEESIEEPPVSVAAGPLTSSREIPSRAEPDTGIAKKRRRRGRRGGRGRRRGPAEKPALAASASESPVISQEESGSGDSQAAAFSPPSSPAPLKPASIPYRVPSRASSSPARSATRETVSEPSPESLPQLRGRTGDPGLSSRMAHLESQLRRLLACASVSLDQADQAPAGPGVFIVSDSDQITYYYVEACQTLRIGVANLLRADRSSTVRRTGGDSLRERFAEHLEISESKVSKYLRDHCCVRWIQLDDGARVLAHFAIAVLHPALND